MKKITTTSSITGLITATSASAAIQLVTTPEIAFAEITGATQDIEWDIDGNGTTDLQINAFASFSYFLTFSFTAANNFVRKENKIAGLDSQQLVGPTSAMGTPYDFQTQNATMFFNTFNSALNGGVSTAGLSLSSAPSLIGFRFEREGNTHYGVASIVTEAIAGQPRASITVERWAWEDEADTPILAGAAVVPEPAQVANALGLLALGAAGLRRWRKNN